MSEMTWSELLSKVKGRKGGRGGRLPIELGEGEYATILDRMRSGQEVPRRLIEAAAWLAVMNGADFEEWSTEAILDLIDGEADALELQIQAGIEAARQAVEMTRGSIGDEELRSARRKAEDLVCEHHAHWGAPQSGQSMIRWQLAKAGRYAGLCPLVKPLSIRPGEPKTGASSEERLRPKETGRGPVFFSIPSAMVGGKKFKVKVTGVAPVGVELETNDEEEV